MLRPFLYTLLAVNVCLAAGGAVYAVHQNIPASLAAPIVAAFLLQISFYLVPGFPAVRRRSEERLSPVLLAVASVLAAVAPYLLYSLATGVFHFPALLKLLTGCTIVAFVFVLWPTRRPGLTWQDLVVTGTVAVMMLGKIFRQIYLSPIAGLRLESMGQIMIIGLSATAFLSLRQLKGSGYQLRASWADWKTGIRQFLFFIPIGLPVGLAIGFVGFHPLKADLALYPILLLGTFLGMYAVVALLEELFFRGVLQNLATTSLGNAVAAQAIASIVFGLAHLPFRTFPNWRFAILATIAGWFYGQAYRERQSMIASSITHALVNTTWRFLFSGN